MATTDSATDKAPAVTLLDQSGIPVALEALWKQGPLVVFFYPKDNTPGCTKEVCHFRDSLDAFVEAGSQVVGISSDDQASHKAFAARHTLRFGLLSDPDGAARKAFGVKKTLGLLPGRETFVIDTQGHICHRFNSLTNTQGHVETALKIVVELQRNKQAR